MIPIYSTALSAAVVVFLGSLGQAAAKPRIISPTVQARIMLERIDSWSASRAATADRIQMRAPSQEGSASQLAGLDSLKDDVNNIGRDLRILETEQASLPEWESKVVDEMLPLMQEIAAKTEKAIQTYASDRNHLWATSFYEETAKVFEDAGQVKRLLDGNLRLATVREREQRLESTLNGSR